MTQLARRPLLAWLALVVLLAVPAAVFPLGTRSAVAEEPPQSTRWMLDMEHGKLGVAHVRSLSGDVKSYFYIPVKVTNNTAHARNWYGRVSALTDTGKTYVAMGYAEALPEVKAELRNPNLVPIESTTGKIQPKQTLDTVAIFGPMDPLWDEVRIHIYGLTSAIGIYKVAKYSTGNVIQDVAYQERNDKVLAELRKEVGDGPLPEPEVEYQEVSERRVFEIVYTRPGDEFRPDDDLISFKSEGWTIIGEVQTLRVIEVQ